MNRFGNSKKSLIAEIALIALLPGVAILLANHIHSVTSQQTPVTRLVSFAAPDSASLERQFMQVHYSWPPGKTVPALVPDRIPPDLDSLTSTRRKRLFFQALLPAVLAEDNRIRQEREFLEHAFRSNLSTTDQADRVRIKELAERYRVVGELKDRAFQQRLLRRVDSVPFALVLAQGAKESGWGTSRFAIQANSLFGLWTYDPEAGVVPQARDPDADHLVRRFADVTAAVRSYLFNINVGHAYTRFRHMREAMRAAGQVRLDPMLLAGGLENYSEMGMTYVAHIRALMQQNALDQMPRPALRSLDDYRRSVE